MILPPLAWLVVYQYLPMWGVQIAFRDYTFRDGIMGSEWVGLKYFDRFVNAFNFWPIVRNTLVLNVYSLIDGFPLPIILALALNSIRREWFKKTVQLVSYAPHFISTVVIVGMLFQFVATEGFFNQILGLFGVEPVAFMGEPQYWKSLYVWSGVWQNVGFGCIIYLAALSGIDPTLHEAAIIDGATRIQRMRDIDLPGILPVAIILLILNMGTLLTSGFEKVILMQNNINKGTSEVIDSYVYNIGIAAPIPQPTRLAESAESILAERTEEGADNVWRNEPEIISAFRRCAAHVCKGANIQVAAGASPSRIGEACPKCRNSNIVSA